VGRRTAEAGRWCKPGRSLERRLLRQRRAGAGTRQYGGQSAKIVQALLGHSSQHVTTEVYTHIFPEEFENLTGKLDMIYGQILHKDHNN
jgi:integrase